MSLVIRGLDHPAIDALGWSLLHFVWQGLAVAGLLMAFLLTSRRTAAPTRYFVACVCLTFMAACPLITWCWLVAQPTSPGVVSRQPELPNIHTALQAAPFDVSRSLPINTPRAIDPPPASDPVGAVAASGVGEIAVPVITQTAQLPASSPTVDPPLVRLRAWIVPFPRWLVSGWILGVLLQSARLFVGWQFVKRIQQLASSPSIGELHSRCQQLASQLGIRHSVRLVQSALIEVPTVLGWIRPLILLPAQALTGLDAAQMDAILAHELAHIRRQDYLVNLVQTVLETLLFYHPAVWWVSHQIRTEREHCCDDIAVEVCGNRVIYARALAEMEALRASPRLTLAANSGSLLGRIKRLIRPASAAQRSIWWAACPIAIAVIGALLTGAYFASSASADGTDNQASSSDQDGTAGEKTSPDTNDSKLRAELKHAIDRARVSLIKTRTAHVSYRVSRGFDSFKPGITPERCAEILQKYDLLKRPDDLRHIVQAIYADPESLGENPWSESELFVDGTKVRNSTASRDGKSNSHVQITDDQLALRWSGGNSQVDIENIKDNHYAQTGLNNFREVQSRTGEKTRIARSNGQFTLTASDKRGNSSEIIVDETTGYVVRRNQHDQDRNEIRETQWLGWQPRSDGIPFPGLIIHFEYKNGTLSRSEIKIVHKSVFNEPLLPSLFKMDAPAGSVIVDSRGGNRAVTSINYDVFDVTSAEQMVQATRGIPKELTPEEKSAIAELKLIYQLGEGELIKRIGPPFPLSHKHVGRMLGRGGVPKPGRSTTFLIQWKDGQLHDPYSYEGLTPHFSDLIYRFLKFGSTEISADPALLDREIDGDFLYRPDAPVAELADQLAKIASTEFQFPVKLSIREGERSVYIAKGEVKLQLPKGENRIAVNGGPEKEPGPKMGMSGDSTRFLSEVSDYIGYQVVNQLQAGANNLEWTQRIYQFRSVSRDKWVRPDPEICLKQITEQTGITFTKQTQKAQMLFVEVDPAAVAPSNDKSTETPQRSNPPANSDPQSKVPEPESKTGQANLPVPAKCELTGHVLDQQGRLVKGATIQVWQSDGVGKTNLVEQRMPVPQSSDRGRFDIPDLPAGEVIVSATFPVSTDQRQYLVVSSRQVVALMPNERAYCRIQLAEPVVPEAGALYLTSGKAHISSTWSAFDFGPGSMQVGGHRPPEKREPLNWGSIGNGLQAALILNPGTTPSTRGATLVVRNTLKDRMLAFHRYQEREEFAFEFIQPDGTIQVEARDIWPLNKQKPSHSWNGIYLRPGDEYELDLGEVTHPANDQIQAGVSLRARLMFYSDNEKVDHLRQEEFYPTSLVETGWVALGQKPKTPDEEAKAAENPLVRLTVLDQRTGQVLPRFAVLPGIEGMLGDVNEAMPFIQWQPHLWREGQTGKLDWPRQRTYDSMRLRIEADGYRPGLTQVIRKVEGPISIQVKLVPDPGLDGRILSPNGQPANKAQVGVAMSAREIWIANRRIRVPEKIPDDPADQWRLPLVIESDSTGRYHLPAEVTPALVIVAHDSGYAEIRRDQLTSATSTITLRPWGRIEGRLLWRDLPGKNQNISLMVSHPNPEWIPLVGHSAKTATDADGRFTFDDVPPGSAHISREQVLATTPDSSGDSVFSFPSMHLDVKATGPTHVVLGGKGQPVIGHLKGLTNWKDVTVRIFPVAPRPGDGDRWTAYSQFADSPAGKLYHREAIPVQEDGTFRIERVLSSQYQWQVKGSDGEIRASGKLQVPPTAEGKSEHPIDLGSIEIK